MSKYYEVKGKITSITRLNCSIYGNPRFTLEIDGEILTTKSDYSYCYDIENMYRQECIVIATCYDTKLSSRIEDIKRV
ncbi:hypothetical protein TPMD03_4 [Thiohalocapsa phage LS06-2018-MD03]|nr:hypothetical protein TPMD03_4 [Thiohalocapsa phage LS06-2018-MD03]